MTWCINCQIPRMQSNWSSLSCRSAAIRDLMARISQVSSTCEGRILALSDVCLEITSVRPSSCDVLLSCCRTNHNCRICARRGGGTHLPSFVRDAKVPLTAANLERTFFKTRAVGPSSLKQSLARPWRITSRLRGGGRSSRRGRSCSD